MMRKSTLSDIFRKVTKSEAAVEGEAMSSKNRDRKTRAVIAALHADGWTLFRKGPGDHVQFKHPSKLGKVTVDTGEPEIPTGTLRSIYRQAGWEW